MTTRSIVALLDLAASTDDELVRRSAIDRLTAHVDVKPEVASVGVRGASPFVERFLDRLRHGGIPARPRALHAGAVELARALVALDAPSLDRFACDLGVVATIVVVRSVDRASAAEIVRTLEESSDRLASLSALAPGLSEEGRERTVAEFTAFARRGFAGSPLTRALGRSLVASLLREAEPDAVAFIRERLPLAATDLDAADPAWFPVALHVTSHCSAQTKSENHAH